MRIKTFMCNVWCKAGAQQHCIFLHKQLSESACSQSAPCSSCWRRRVSLAQVHLQLLVPSAAAVVLTGGHLSLALAWNLCCLWNFPGLPRKAWASFLPTCWPSYQHSLTPPSPDGVPSAYRKKGFQFSWGCSSLIKTTIVAAVFGPYICPGLHSLSLSLSSVGPGMMLSHFTGEAQRGGETQSRSHSW